jgi:hypothetical protein
MPAPIVVEGLPQAVEGTQSYGGRFFFMNILASPAIVATIIAAEQTITVTGLAAGDVVVTINKPTQQTIGLLNGRVSAANTLQMAFVNPTAGGVTPTASQVYTLLIFRPSA